MNNRTAASAKWSTVRGVEAGRRQVAPIDRIDIAMGRSLCAGRTGERGLATTLYIPTKKAIT